ncbi:DUF262 domain-containing protein [Paraliomyxa miuraensis]|uniref:DUF262 domain-containing protein n=1 Tax=Paraliomyxa miuraensis TaxID=376150 RepID=UPI00225B5F7A|nr:DUF262 domain-containing protein [Paraliomyxa miuraensis]MCX4240892.1 DUF262 domain-containing protein [Paraliomyxa miuraensis]
MTGQPITKPNAVTFPLEDILGEVLNGRVRIPDFQRKFKWQWEDVRRLLDSIVRGYPVGSLLLWSRPAKAADFVLGALTLNAPELDDALWVVDGQQRLTSLANALSDAGCRDPRFASAYDLENSRFVKAAEPRAHVVPLPIVFDLQRLLRWFADHPESTQYFDEATRVAKAIRQYAIPAYIVKHQDEAVLRDIFDRVNNHGRRLTRAEVFSALHRGEGREGPPPTFADIVEQIDVMRGFGEIDEDTVLRAVLARRGSDVTREIRAEFSRERVSREFPDEGVEDAYRHGGAALLRAVAFLQDEAFVPHFGFLTYRYLLVVLARFFAHHPDPGPRNLKLLRRWFWRASLEGPEKYGSWTEAMRARAAQVQPGDESQSVQSLLAAVDVSALRFPKVEKFRSVAAYSRTLLCAMWANGPRSVVTGEPYDRPMLTSALQGSKTAREIVPRIFKREPEGMETRAANRFILLGDDTLEDARACFSTPPMGMSTEVWTATLSSHRMSHELSSLLSCNQRVEFLNAREVVLTTLLRDFLARVTEVEFEDTPPLDDLDLDDDDDVEVEEEQAHAGS